MSELKSRWHPSVVAMANAMQEKLDKNEHKDGWNKKGKRGWLLPNCDVEFLISKLNEETEELRHVVRRDNIHMPIRLLDDIRLEAADVANIAMMIADNLGAYGDDHDNGSGDSIPF